MSTASPWHRRLTYVVLIAAAAAVTAGVMYLALDVTERKEEGRERFFKVVEVSDWDLNPELWGANFPRQYEGYRATARSSGQTEFGGSEKIDRLEHDPRLVRLFAGYAFSLEYDEERGHAYMLQDQETSQRVLKKQQPGACLHCHASVIPAYYGAGVRAGADEARKGAPFTDAAVIAAIEKGFAAVCALPYQQARPLVDHPVSCADCHDAETMRLRVTRPGFTRGIASLANGEAPVPVLPSIQQWRDDGREGAYDANHLASRQEMRTLVCAQCHVEYYFKGETAKLLTYPWDDGLTADQIESYYDRVGWRDWEHAESGAPVLKAQHPEFETWTQGVHASSGVACADCHMPYMRSGAVKISDHQVRSPLFEVNRACGSCHPYSDDEIRARVRILQERVADLLSRAEDGVVDLIDAIATAERAGADDDQLKAARDYQRKAQWRVDFVNAENSMGFHAPHECERTLALALDYAGKGLLAVAELQRP